LRSQENSRTNGAIKAVDVFCGAGGLTHGLIKAGIDVRLGIDIDPACEYPYSANNNTDFLLKSVEGIGATDLLSAFGDNGLRLLAGCAPCQTFSTYYQKASSEDIRWHLLLEFSRLVKEISPDFVTMENVPGLLRHSVFNKFIDDLESANYKVFRHIVDCSEYGIPQVRSRLVLIASKWGELKLLTPSEFGQTRKTVREAIGALPPINAGQTHDHDPLHRSSELSNLNMRRMKASKPGGTWRDWDESLITTCHKKKSGKTYSSIYGRMKWDDPAPTITTQFYGFGNGRFGHPEQNRAISLREGAILQSFPECYEFSAPGEPIHIKTIGRLIGNAVPVVLGEVIGKSLIAHLSKLDS